MITREQIEKTTAEWAADNPVLAADVIGIEVTTTGYNRFKRGDGVTAWANLAYLDKVPPSTSSGGGDLDISVVDNRIALHNGSETAHNDLRVLISGLDILVSELGARLNTIADSDDVDLDQFSEIVAFIKSNRNIIEQVTTLKVNYTDIINNLTTDLADKPLSAAQGVVLKGLIDGLSSGKLDASELTNAINTALAQAKESGEFDGADGKDGAAGATGKDGTSVTVSSVQESTADGGSNVVTFSDGSALTVKNGSKGSTGDTGATGADGYTPVKGTDYYTNAEKAAIVNEVIAGIPSGTVTNAVTLTTAQTVSGIKTFAASNFFDGEQKLAFSQYCPTVTDIANGIGASMKNARAVDCQLYVSEIYAPYCGPNTTGKTEATSGLTATNGQIDFYMITGASNGQPTGRTLLMQLKPDGLYVLGRKVLTE